MRYRKEELQTDIDGGEKKIPLRLIAANDGELRWTQAFAYKSKQKKKKYDTRFFGFV